MSALVCEPEKDKVLLTERIHEVDPKTVLLIFWHGVGDLVMFLQVYKALEYYYKDIVFQVGVPKGLGYLDIVPDAVELTGDEVNNNDLTSALPFDLVAKITFPMNEGQTRYTKSEWCCRHEIGIPPVWGHGFIPKHRSRLVAVHFQITCLPDSCNPDQATAERIWNDILESGYVPLECHFEHIFHNPVNKKFDFIDASVRRCRSELGSLVGLIGNAGAFVGVVSGPFHVALSTLPHKRVLLLEKDFKKECFTKSKELKTANLKDYQGEVKTWLASLEK